MQTPKSIRQLDERMADLEPGTIRHEALEAAKRFKSSWIELGRVLWTVWREKKFKEWGYLTFDAYCAKEVGIKAATAKKLLHSYYFLEKEEPSLLKKLSVESPANLPHVDSVNLLRMLNQRPQVPADEYRQVRNQVLEKGREAPEVRREIRSMLQAAEPDPEAVRASRRQSAIRRMITALKSMKLELGSSNLVPRNLLSEIDSLAKKLEEIL